MAKSREMACRHEHLTRDFSHALCTSDCEHTHCMAQDESRLRSVSVRVSFHPHVIHDVVCLSIRWSFLVSLFLVSLRLLFLSVFYFFSSTLHLFPTLHLQCRHRRGLKPLQTRRMRSIAPRRHTILSQVMSPSSSTTSTTQRLLQRSSRTHPATQIQSLRTRAMRNSTMRLSEKRYLHHRSFMSEKNQRTRDKHVTLMKKVCCQLSPVSHTQVR